jgi:hypothetical protein
MIVVRDIFRMRFGQSREVTRLWKQGLEIVRHLGYHREETRLLTDVAGESFYTLILESTWDTLAEWEHISTRLRETPEWQQWYQKVVPLIETGRREILAVVE